MTDVYRTFFSSSSFSPLRFNKSIEKNLIFICGLDICRYDRYKHRTTGDQEKPGNDSLILFFLLLQRMECRRDDLDVVYPLIVDDRQTKIGK